MRCHILAIAASAMLPTLSAHADFVQVRDNVGGEFAVAPGEGFFLEGTGGMLGSQLNGAFPAPLETGVFDLQMDWGDGNGFSDNGAFSIQPARSFGFGTNLPDNVGATYIDLNPLFGGLLPNESTDAGVLWANAYDFATADSLSAAAFQAYMWELAQDDNFDLLTGNYRLDLFGQNSIQVLSLAEQWRANIDQGVWTDSVPLVVLISESSQDLITAVPLVPAPAGVTLTLASAGLLLRRRRA